MTSLPGPFGSGDLGTPALDFADWLQSAGQTWWQMLPVGPIGPGNSPYSSHSAFAGNPYLISLTGLQKDGWLPARALNPPPKRSANNRIRYASAMEYRDSKLDESFAVFAQKGHRAEGYVKFCREHKDWLDDFALFAALKEIYPQSWWNWPEELRHRDRLALRQIKKKREGSIKRHKFLQFLFHRQWQRFRKHCELRDIRLLGDVPIFVIYDSADVWAHPHLFRLDAQLRPQVVSGVPPDAFSDTGQLWGHPHFRWAAHRREDFAWWTRRFEVMLQRFHAVRIDHFIGFHNAWEVPADAATAANGTWKKAPGKALFQAVTKKLGDLPVVAEDLGAVTPEVHALRDSCGFPGMRVLQWAFGEGARYDQPHNHPPHAVVYPGTHDNDTVRGWFASLPKTDRIRVLQYTQGDPQTIAWDLVRLAYGSPANTCICPLQDLLNLDQSARMNIPGTASGNWEWRCRANSWTRRLAQRLNRLADTYERLPPS